MADRLSPSMVDLLGRLDRYGSVRTSPATGNTAAGLVSRGLATWNYPGRSSFIRELVITDAGRERLVEVTRCAHNGGQGVGAGHTCKCVRSKGHPLDSDRPHGCSCGALWPHG